MLVAVACPGSSWDNSALHLPVHPAPFMHIRCPHCRNPIELFDESEHQSIDCPDCGSQFGLVDVDERDVDTLPVDRASSKRIGRFQLIQEVGSGGFLFTMKRRRLLLLKIV